MFYLKTELANSKVVKIDITDENVFTRCPDCGRELPVDLVEILSDGEGDLFSTSITCSACTQKRAEKRRHNDRIKITVDGIALLFEAVQELVPEQYESFADALKAIATEGGGL